MSKSQPFSPDEDDKALVVDDSVVENDEIIIDDDASYGMDARRRLEYLLEEKRLREDLDDFCD